MNFWSKLPQPIIGLAPMDGVTDAAFRYITDKYGKPDILFTEFIPVEAIDRGIVKILHAFVHHRTKTPTVAQIFGHDLKAFYKATIVACEMGYDGIDINMGCPDRHIVARGGGAALILQPKHAKKIIATVKKAVNDWLNGLTLQSASISDEIIFFITSANKKNGIQVKRKLLPVSVKTRIGFDKVITKEWISHLIESEPSAISLHGRTLKQLYSGEANWNEIGIGSSLCSKANIIFFGNGDVKSLNEALDKAKLYKTNGILIGRASLGNPWVFKNTVPTLKNRFKVLIEHTKKFMEYRQDLKLFPMRKHFTWYCKPRTHDLTLIKSANGQDIWVRGKGFDNSAKIRNELMKVSTLDELRTILASATTY